MISPSFLKSRIWSQRFRQPNLFHMVMICWWAQYHHALVFISKLQLAKSNHRPRWFLATVDPRGRLDGLMLLLPVSYLCLTRSTFILRRMCTSDRVLWNQTRLEIFSADHSSDTMPAHLHISHFSIHEDSASSLPLISKSVHINYEDPKGLCLDGFLFWGANERFMVYWHSPKRLPQGRWVLNGYFLQLQSTLYKCYTYKC